MVGFIANNPNLDAQQDSLDTDELLEQLSGEEFQKWYRERQWRQNIEDGQPYFNGPGKVPSSDRHSPSQLLQCHRKLLYRQENAPAEQPDPRGIFWFGTQFEENLLFPFLSSTVTGSGTYVRNSVWIDFTIETSVGELRVKGATDPVIVDADAVPILPTEVKTKSSIENVTRPNRHHRAQVHAYLVGLSEKFDKKLSDAVLVYGGRERLGIKTFHVDFDNEFWHDVVLDWATDHTKYRIDGELPPADPEYEWECRFCSYQNRCGKGETPHTDYGPNGLLPGFGGYPREEVTEYLEEHQEEVLTPSLARRYPGLVGTYGVADWHCRTCNSEIDWKRGEDASDPLCPNCAEEGKLSNLTLLTPEEQGSAENNPEDSS